MAGRGRPASRRPPLSGRHWGRARSGRLVAGRGRRRHGRSCRRRGGQPVAVEAFVHTVEQGGGLPDGLQGRQYRGRPDSRGQGRASGMGATLVAAQVRGDEVRWISVGDPPFFLVSSWAHREVERRPFDGAADRRPGQARHADGGRGGASPRPPYAARGRDGPAARPSWTRAAARSVPTSLLLCSDGVQSLSEAEIAANAIKPADGLIEAVLAAAKEHPGQHHGDQAGACAMGKSVVIEVTRGPVVESRHEGSPQSCGPTVRWWRRGVTSTLRAAALGGEADPGHGVRRERRRRAVRSRQRAHRSRLRLAQRGGGMSGQSAWLAKVGPGRGRPSNAAPMPRAAGRIEELRAGQDARQPRSTTARASTRLPPSAVQYGEPTKGYIKYDHPVQAPLA